MSLKKPRRVALYVRVSTKDQTTEHQRRELNEVAERAGWNVVATFCDEGVSGAKGRDRRPGLDALLKAVTQRKVDMVAAWSVDRLGRSLKDLVETLGDLQSAGADLYLHKQALDTSTPAGRAMFQMLGVFAEFEREMMLERVQASMETARANGKQIGRPKVAEEVEAGIAAMLAQGTGKLKIARTLRVGVSTVQRVAAMQVAA